MTEHQAEELKKTSPEVPPAANQGKDEPIASAPDTSAQSSPGDARAGDAAAGDGSARDAAAAGSSSIVPGEPGEAPRAMEVDDVRAAATMANAATMPASATGGVPTPGDAKGVAVPAVQAAAGSSEESGQVHGVRTTAIAPPGKPDGEVDTRA